MPSRDNGPISKTRERLLRQLHLGEEGLEISHREAKRIWQQQLLSGDGLEVSHCEVLFCLRNELCCFEQVLCVNGTLRIVASPWLYMALEQYDLGFFCESTYYHTGLLKKLP